MLSAMKCPFGALVLASLLGTGCADLNVETLCSRDPNDPRCPQDTALDTTVGDGAVDAMDDGGDVGDSRLDVTSLDVDPDVTPDVPDPLDAADSGVDSDATTDISADTIDSTLADTTDTLDTAIDSAADSTPDAVDSTPDSDTSIVVDSKADSDSGADTADVGCVGPSTQVCGNCGSQSRTCTAGTWSAFGTCAGVGECAAGASGGAATGCAWFESGTRTCSATCTWTNVCTATRGWHRAKAHGFTDGWNNDSRGVWTGDEVLMVGGKGTAGGLVGYAYNPQKNTWRSLAAVPAAMKVRSQFGYVWANNLLYMYGGYSEPRGFGGELLGDLYSYNPKTDKWELLKRPPLSARSQPAVGFVGGKLVVGGGDGCEMIGCGFKAAALNLATDTWTTLPDAPSPLTLTFAFADITGVLFADGTLNTTPNKLSSSGVWGSTTFTTDYEQRNGPANNCASLFGATGFACSNGYLRSATPAYLNPVIGFYKTGWAYSTAAPIGGRESEQFWCSSADECTIFGGFSSGGTFGDGASYSTVTSKWTAIPEGDARAYGSAFWTGKYAVIVGGSLSGASTTDAVLYVP